MNEEFSEREFVEEFQYRWDEAIRDLVPRPSRHQFRRWCGLVNFDGPIIEAALTVLAKRLCNPGPSPVQDPQRFFSSLLVRHRDAHTEEVAA